MTFTFGPRRGIYIDIGQEVEKTGPPLTMDEVNHFEILDLLYRSLCALLYNYAPLSGHPGGSISSGRFVAGILFDTLDYDVSQPNREDADIISYAAGHKAMGLYAMWALRNEVMRIGAPELLPADESLQLRLEDLLGFRRNPITTSPLFVRFKAKALDGHPTPATPFVRLSTGASGVGVATSLGLAYGALDYYGEAAPRVHIVEGEGGMTPGRVSEALAAAGTASLKNVVMHVDWNQASIDSNQVCRDGDKPGDYVQWTPMELAYLHDWNVIFVPDGKDFQQIIAAQRQAANINNSQPTAIVYRTIKGWQYGIEGKKSHGAGHSLCSAGFYEALQPLLEQTGGTFPYCSNEEQRCKGNLSEIIEECFWNALTVIREALADNYPAARTLAYRLVEARNRLNQKHRQPRAAAPTVGAIYELAQSQATTIPPELELPPGKVTTLRGTLGAVLRYYNKASNGAIFSASADLLGSTSVNVIGQDFGEGYFNADTNPGSRALSIGGICEDAMSGVMAGLSTYGHHIGVCSSYGAFIAALGHIASRLHAIGNEARHAGIKTGEDGPTHADPQPLQLVQENFPKGAMITLTPWEPQEIWTLVSAALVKRPAVICPFVTRPGEKVLDRAALDLAPATAAATGVYLLHGSKQNGGGALVLQGSEVAYEFATYTLPKLLEQGLDLDAYYIASAELFDLLPEKEQQRIFPEERAQVAMGMTGFTLPTLYRWIRSDYGRQMSLHPFGKGHFLGSGKANMVVKEAGLDGESQLRAVMQYLENLK